MKSISEIAAVEEPQSVPRRGGPIRVLVSEPDTVSCRLICSVLKYQSEMSVTCVDDCRLVSAVKKTAPDLVIVDIHMPAIRLITSWEAVGVKSAPVTIITAYAPSAVTAFASTAIDFLVKPFDVERLEASLDLATSSIARVRTELQDEEGPSEHREERSVRHFLQRMAVEANEKIVLVKVEDIRWMQSSGNHIRLHVAKTSYLIRQSLANLQAMLDPGRFLRVHRNAIVNLDHVEEFHLPTNGNMFVKLNDGLCLPLRKASRVLLRKLLKSHFVA